ncbi:aminoglycoside phosphotransferase family protein [Patescibacteria group bacterium]|nr:aminoglycoside phosphotransferase family protein [Patescibacteria group bacterium]MBU1907052.1 aminoglycoside phosphotransferase family protein [Patescibacteria group bacterium]
MRRYIERIIKLDKDGSGERRIKVPTPQTESLEYDQETEQRLKQTNEFAEMMHEARARSKKIGEGTTAEVFCYDTDEVLQGLVSKTSIEHARKPGENSVEAEFDLQLQAWHMVNRWRTEYPKVSPVYVPRPIGFVEEKGEHTLIMEKVEGKTLWRMLLENYLQSYKTNLIEEGYFQNEDQINDLLKLTDVGIEDHLINMTDLQRYRNNPREIERIVWRTCSRRGSAVLTEEQFNSIFTFAGLAAREKFWHRDFHAKNVMIADDGRVYVIDFGLSKAGGTEEDAMSFEEMGQKVLVTAGYQAIIRQLRESGNGANKDQRVPMAKWLRS